MSAMTVAPVMPRRPSATVRASSAGGVRTAGLPARPRTGAVGADPTTRLARADGGRPLRLTSRGRRVVVSIALLMLAGLVLIGGRAMADGPQRAPEVRSHSLVQGETLWSLAAELAGPGQDVRDVVDEIADLNGISAGELRAGERILLPLQE